MDAKNLRAKESYACIVLLATLLFLGYVACGQNKLMLVATGKVNIMQKDYPIALRDSDKNDILWVAKANDTLIVKKKYYTKDCMVYKIITKAGIVGYVFYGDSIEELPQRCHD